jgi:hypothetical protein
VSLFKTTVTGLLGMEYHIIVGVIRYTTLSGFTAAVSSAGGLGL